MKHNRIPVPDLSFNCPNLPFLIGEIERLFGEVKKRSHKIKAGGMHDQT